MTLFHIMKCLSIIAGSREWAHKELIVGEKLDKAGFSIGSPLDCIEKILFAPVVCIQPNKFDSKAPLKSVELDQMKMSVHAIRKEAILILKSLIMMYKDCMIMESAKEKSAAEKKKKNEDEKKTKGGENSNSDNETPIDDKIETKVYSWQKAQNILTSENYKFKEKFEKLLGVKGKGGGNKKQQEEEMAEDLELEKEA